MQTKLQNLFLEEFEKYKKQREAISEARKNEIIYSITKIIHKSSQPILDQQQKLSDEIEQIKKIVTKNDKTIKKYTILLIASLIVFLAISIFF